MPRKSRGLEIVAAIREYLPHAVEQPDPITDERLMAVAVCARATFYKHVTEDSAIRREINYAREHWQIRWRPQKGRTEGDKEKDVLLAQVRAESEMGKDANRQLIAHMAQFVSNLMERGVSVAAIQSAQQDAMSHPERRVSHSGLGRNKSQRRR